MFLFIFFSSLSLIGFGAREPPIVGLLLQRKRTKRKETFA